MKKPDGSAALIFLIILIDLIGFGIIIPILPRYSETHFGANEIQIGILIASFSFFQFLSSPILGKLSDRVGRKPVISFSLILSSLSYVIFAFAPNYWIAFLSRSIAGIGGGSISAAQAYISDVTEKSERTKGMGLIGSAFGLGFVLGPFIGGMLASFGYIVPNLAAAGFSFTALILTRLFLRESLKQNIKSNDKFDYLTISFEGSRFKKAFSNIYIGRFLLIFFIITFSIANTYGVIPIFAYRYLNFTDREIGYVYAVIGIVGVIFQGFLVGRLSKIISEKKLLITGMILMSAGLAMIPHSINYVYLIWFFVVIASIGLALINPTILSFISKLASPEEQGEVFGVNQSMGSLGRVFGPVWGGFAFNAFGYGAPFWTASVFTLAGLYFCIENFLRMKKNKFEI